MAARKKELVKQGDAALPAFLQEYEGRTYAEDIDNDDVTIPRVKLAQGLTPEVKAGDVSDGALFLNIDGQVLAEPEKPLRFIPVAKGKEFILWNPQRGEGILARGRAVQHGGRTRYEWDKQDASFDVKFKDGPKVTWETKRFVDENGMDKWGSRIPGDDDSGPAATAHFNYVVILPDFGNMVAALSLSRSQVKRAKDLNALFKMGNLPFFARVFEVTTTPEKNDDGDYFNYKFVPAGVLEDANLFTHAKGLHDGFVETGYTVDQSDEDDSETATGGGTSI